MTEATTPQGPATWPEGQTDASTPEPDLATPNLSGDELAGRREPEHLHPMPGPQGPPPAQPPEGRRKIAIVGMAPSRDEAPWDQRHEWELWGINTLYQMPQCGEENWDCWFEMHDLDWLRLRPANVSSGYWEWLQQPKSFGRPIYMLRPDPRVPNSQPYPLAEIMQKFGRYFRSTIDYMLAMAIDRRPDEIGLWGVDMALLDEYQEQRPSCEYYIGLAVGLGIKVHIPHRGDIMKMRKPYGLDTYDEFPKKLEARQRELAAQAEAQANQERSARDQKMLLRGALDDMAWVRTNWL